MRYLIDTQIAIWAKGNSPQLKPEIVKIIEDSENEIFVSQFSLQEIAIKLKLGKLPDFIVSLDEFIQTLVQDDYLIYPIKIEHIVAYNKIPLFEGHRDTFDRFILATAFYEDFIIISSDIKFRKYAEIVKLQEA